MKPKVQHTVRHHNGDGSTVTVTLTRGLAIKYMCQECCGWEFSPRECGDENCPLYPWRPTSFIPTYGRRAVSEAQVAARKLSFARVKPGKRP